MVSYTSNYNLAMYDPVTDASELFLAYRSDMAGTSSSNVTKIETALTGLQDSIDTINANKSAVFVDAGYVSPNLFQATGISGITAYTTNLKIILRLDADSDGTVTLNINSLGIKSVYKINDAGTGVNLTYAHLKKNKEYLLRYNGTVWILISDLENPAVVLKNIETLSASKTLTDYSETMHDLDPNGSARDVNLPAEDSKNPYFVIYNSGSSGYALTVKSDAPATIGTVNNGEIKIFYSTGVQWLTSLEKAGSSFPSSPYTGQEFFRSDVGFDCYYDGSDWVTKEIYTVDFEEVTISATTESNHIWIGDDNEVKFVRVELRTYVDTTNNGSNYWTVLVRSKALDNSQTNILNTTTAADSPDVYVDNGVLPATAKPINYGAINVRGGGTTGSPGDLTYSVTVKYRRVLT